MLEGTLGEGFEEFDGLILAERSRAQRERDEAGADPGGLYEDEGDRGGRGGGTIWDAGGIEGMIESSSGGGGTVASSSDGGQGPESGGSGGSMGGPQGGPVSESDEDLYPVPDDIPSGRNDDVVARQIREAAQRESDPELREALWDEYRRYTGLE